MKLNSWTSTEPMMFETFYFYFLYLFSSLSMVFIFFWKWKAFQTFILNMIFIYACFLIFTTLFFIFDRHGQGLKQLKLWLYTSKARMDLYHEYEIIQDIIFDPPLEAPGEEPGEEAIEEPGQHPGTAKVKTIDFVVASPAA